jgi:hypothetical protein
MEIWHWLRTRDNEHFISEIYAKKAWAKFGVYDLMEAEIKRDYKGLKVKYSLSDEDVSKIKTALKNGRWKILTRATIN